MTSQPSWSTKVKKWPITTMSLSSPAYLVINGSDTSLHFMKQPQRQADRLPPGLEMTLISSRGKDFKMRSTNLKRIHPRIFGFLFHGTILDHGPKCSALEKMDQECDKIGLSSDRAWWRSTPRGSFRQLSMENLRQGFLYLIKNCTNRVNTDLQQIGSKTAGHKSPRQRNTTIHTTDNNFKRNLNSKDKG